MVCDNYFGGHHRVLHIVIDVSIMGSWQRFLGAELVLETAFTVWSYLLYLRHVSCID